MCPTRWTVRANALQSIMANYEALFKQWEESLAHVRETEMRTCIIGVQSYMKILIFLGGGVLLGDLILRHSDNLSKTLQSPKLSAAEAQKVVAMTFKNILEMKTTSSFFGQPHLEREMNCLSVILNYPEDKKLLDGMKLVVLKVM